MSKLAKVTRLPDDQDEKDKLVVYFSIPGEIDDEKAYPLDNYDECSIGDEIIVYNTGDLIGQSYFYNKLRLENYTRLKLGDGCVEVHSDGHVIINGGSKGRVVNEEALTKILLSLSEDLKSLPHGNFTKCLYREFPNLYDEFLTH